MQFKEFGKQNSELCLLIHDNLVTWKQFQECIPYLEQRFHVLAVTLDGFDDVGLTTYRNAREEAMNIGDYLKIKYGGHIHVLFGEGFGCIPAFYLQREKDITVDLSIFDGPLCMDVKYASTPGAWLLSKGQYQLYNRLHDENTAGSMSERVEKVRSVTAKASEILRDSYLSLKDRTVDSFAAVRHLTADGLETVMEKTTDSLETVKEKTADSLETLKAKTPDQLEAVIEKTVDGFGTIKSRTLESYENVKARTAANYDVVKSKTADQYENMKAKTADQYENMKAKTADRVEAVQDWAEEQDEIVKAWREVAPAKVTEESLRFLAKDAINFYKDLESAQPDADANVSVWFAEKDFYSRKAINALRTAYPKAYITRFSGLKRGEIITYPDKMAAKIIDQYDEVTGNGQ